MSRTRHIKYSEETIELIVSRMPDEFYKQLARLYFGTYYTTEQLAVRFNYCKRTINRYIKKMQEMVKSMDDLACENFKEETSNEPCILKKCPICGKNFVPAPQHYWKIGATGKSFDSRFDARNISVCSYSCMRKWEKANGM